MCLSIGDANFDHLLKVLSVRLFQCKVTIFPFVIDTCLTE